MKKHVQAGAVLLGTLLAYEPRTSLACSLRDKIGAVIWPAGLANVPTDVHIFADFIRPDPNLASEVYLLVSGATVALSMVEQWQGSVLYSFPVPNYPFAQLEEWQPATELLPDTEYRVVIRTSRLGSVVERVEESFRTGPGRYGMPFGPPVRVGTYYQRDLTGPSIIESCSNISVDELTQCSLTVPPTELALVFVGTPEVDPEATLVDVPKTTYVVPRPNEQFTRLGFFGISGGPLCYRLTIIDGIGRREEVRHCEVDACAEGWLPFTWGPVEWTDAGTAACSNVVPKADAGATIDSGGMGDAPDGAVDAGVTDTGSDGGDAALTEGTGCGCSASLSQHGRSGSMLTSALVLFALFARRRWFRGGAKRRADIAVGPRPVGLHANH